LLRWLARGVLVADTYGPPLVWAAAHPLALIKINADELRSLPTATAVSPPSAGPLPPPPGPTRRWVVSDGPRRVVVWEGAIAAEITPPAVAEISATGSGDVLLACLLQALFIHRRPLVDAVRYALPYASANAAHPGIAEFPEPPGAEKLPPLPPS
jgi:fructose-1-phosphate kinase PfkB-like protein